MICWRCGANFMAHSVTGNCLICGYEQDIDHVQMVRVKKGIHDLTGENPKSYGSDKNYPIRKRWSMKD